MTVRRLGMAGPKQDYLVDCYCPRCNGAKIPQSTWLIHNGQATSRTSWMAEDLKVLREMWSRGERLTDYLKEG
jgi:hypothetical protein